MKKILSKIDGSTICSLIRKSEISTYRNEICSSDETLQMSARKLTSEIFVPPHKHLPVIRNTEGTQEIWILLSGSILATIYDLDNEFLDEIKLTEGDAIVLHRGGHSLKSLDDDTIFYEIKNGPYKGIENDKVSIN